MPFVLSRICHLRLVANVALLLLLAVHPSYSQSTDVRSPTAVVGNEIAGKVPARDIGDARLTDHFYTFNGAPGDLLITIESKNLNGDFDVFSAADLRPLVKVVVYAESDTAVTKNIYLRRSESLILRVEGRTPNDDQGTYRIRFSGSFLPVDNHALTADAANPNEEPAQPAKAGDRKTTRVTSSGARVEEPSSEVATIPTTEPIETKPAEKSTRASSVPRNPTARRPTPRKSPVKSAERVSVPGRSSTADTAAAKPAATEESDETVVPAPKRPTPRRSQPAATRSSARIARPEATAENGRLLIEVKDGSRIEYLMSTVSRLTVENGEIVIVSDDGYTKRVPLRNVLRMSIAP